tara:strand:+ start:73 stop:543 length:471 start_codon:yes stop_codon:yes gene_type:complete
MTSQRNLTTTQRTSFSSMDTSTFQAKPKTIANNTFCYTDADGNTQYRLHHKALTKSINKFVKLVDTVDTLPTPDNGDCWYCLMLDTVTPGCKISNADHLQAHIEEGYLHGTLLFNALRWAGHEEPGFLFQCGVGIDRDVAKRALRRFLKRQLSLAA